MVLTGQHSFLVIMNFKNAFCLFADTTALSCYNVMKTMDGCENYAYKKNDGKKYQAQSDFYSTHRARTAYKKTNPFHDKK
jgi:hypothetical protein